MVAPLIRIEAPPAREPRRHISETTSDVSEWKPSLSVVREPSALGPSTDRSVVAGT